MTKYHDYYEEEKEEDLWGPVIGAVAGILLGVAGIAILDSLLGYRCPHCNSKISKNTKKCDQCHNYVGWE